jgi:hypothetical protein
VVAAYFGNTENAFTAIIIFHFLQEYLSHRSLKNGYMLDVISKIFTEATQDVIDPLLACTPLL